VPHLHTTVWEARLSADPNTAQHVSDLKGSAQEFGAAGFHELHAGESQVPRKLIWFLRARALLFVTICATIGVLLVILPWTDKWTDNPWLLTSPVLRQIVSNGFTRGIASGLGMLDLWLGFWEAIHYHEPK
jgi:hypothetical protein